MKTALILDDVPDAQAWLSHSIARKMLGFFLPNPQPDHEQLSERETEVLRYIAKGMTMPETAKLLGLSPHTVSGYVKDIYRKLNVSSRA